MLMNEDAKIRGEMATQKLLLEKKIENDLAATDRAIRTHFTNEIYDLDSKFTSSINGNFNNKNIKKLTVIFKLSVPNKPRITTTSLLPSTSSGESTVSLILQKI